MKSKCFLVLAVVVFFFLGCVGQEKTDELVFERPCDRNFLMEEGFLTLGHSYQVVGFFSDGEMDEGALSAQSVDGFCNISSNSVAVFSESHFQLGDVVIEDPVYRYIYDEWGVAGEEGYVNPYRRSVAFWEGGAVYYEAIEVCRSEGGRVLTLEIIDKQIWVHVHPNTSGFIVLEPEASTQELIQP